MTHLASVRLAFKIHTIKSAPTQELYAIVFASRYLDILTDFISLTNTLMKLIFWEAPFRLFGTSVHSVVRRSYDKSQDTFRHYFAVACLLLALLVHEKFTFKEVMWTFVVSRSCCHTSSACTPAKD
ncbi:ER lumen protein-retaining receptor [Hibiscus syriacus]|uniref:ER lumen protein-retaining receptor n=1 Tax=Hibiscus syriacus TaxID=106335 RepID=A0A6A2WPQ1_HIBSY|nr:ER lumen protein-retaining receptor [Hibiscus syriacus]